MRRASSIVLPLALSFFSAAAQAGEPTAADRESARALLQEGDKAMDAKDAASAVKAYEAAHALVQLPSTGMAVVRARVALGLLVEAREMAVAVTRIPKAPAEKPADTLARQEAERVADELAGRISSIQLDITAPADAALEVVIDAATVPAAAASAPRKVNPGKRKVRVSAAGYRASEQEVELKERDVRKVPVQLERAGAEGPPTPPPAAPEPAKPPSKPPPPPPPPEPPAGGGPSPLLVAGISVGGVGLVGVGVGAFGVFTMNELSDAEGDPALCPNKSCMAAGREAVDGARTEGHRLDGGVFRRRRGARDGRRADHPRHDGRRGRDGHQGRDRSPDARAGRRRLRVWIHVP